MAKENNPAAKEAAEAAAETEELNIPEGYTKVEFLINPTPAFKLAYNEGDTGIVRNELLKDLKAAKAIRVIS